MKNTIKGLIIIVVLAVIGGAGVYAVNSITSPIVKDNAFALEEDNLKKVLPTTSASSYTQLDLTTPSNIEKIFEVDGVGYVFKMKVEGFKDGTTFMVVLDSDGVIVAFEALENHDTVGIGDGVMKDSFKEGLVDKNAGSDTLDTISGATITSKPVIDGISEAYQFMKENIK